MVKSMYKINDINEYVIKNQQLKVDESILASCNQSFNFLVNYSKDKIIYGINTGFGPMAQYKIDENHINQLQYNLIRSHSAGLGTALEPMYAKSVVFSRISNFLQAKSGVSPEVIHLLINFLNKNIIPEIPIHGGVGASGDLVQLAHLALNLIGEGFVYVDNERIPSKNALKKFNLSPLSLQLRDGLAIMNGTSCMTGIAALNQLFASRLINWCIITSSMLNDIVESFDDSFSVALNNAKKHKGQQAVAEIMRTFLKGSSAVKNRYDYFTSSDEHEKLIFEKKVQEYYSIRCVPQIIGPVYDALEFSKNIIEQELNSTNDNPIVDVEAGHVYHGGNFHGDYIAYEMDKMKIGITKLTILLERQLAYLMNFNLNQKFPPFLNSKILGLNFGLQGVQFTATSNTAENQTLSNPMSIHSISNNNDNQDVVSMGTNAALLTKKVIDNAFEVLAIQITAICQAIEMMHDKAKLSDNSIIVWKEIRKHSTFVTDDIPQYEQLKTLFEFLKNNDYTIK